MIYLSSSNNDDRRYRSSAYETRYTNERPSLRDRFTSEIPRSPPHPSRFETVDAAYQTGKIDTDAERYGPIRPYEAPYPPAGFSTDYQGPMERARTRYRVDTDEYSRRRAETDAEIDAYTGQRVDGRRKVASHSRPTGLSYPEYYDRSRYNVHPESPENSEFDGDGPDIVSQLLLEWTPTEPGVQEENERETHKEGIKVRRDQDLGSIRHGDLGFEKGGNITTPQLGKRQSQTRPAPMVESPKTLSDTDEEGISRLTKEQSIHQKKAEAMEKDADSLKGKTKVSGGFQTREEKFKRPSQTHEPATSTFATQPAWLGQDYAKWFQARRDSSGISRSKLF